MQFYKGARWMFKEKRMPPSRLSLTIGPDKALFRFSQRALLKISRMMEY
jgi:hypothetical protein